MTKIVAGVDDSGRGSVIGPLVIAGVAMREDRLHFLKELGVRDCKLLSPAKRKALAVKLRTLLTRYEVIEVSPSEIDKVVRRGEKLRKLNYLEAKIMARIIEKIKPSIAYVDASDVLADRFGEEVRSMVPFDVQVISKHKADRDYPIVAAASILAKVRRDEVVAELREKYGDFGSGYATDPKVKAFLINWFKRYKEFPDFVRETWRTAKMARRSLEVKGKT
jgi:ribonuclease HII